MTKKTDGWRERVEKVLHYDCGNLEIAFGILVDGETEPILKQIEKEIEKAKAVAKIEGAIEVLEKLNINRHSYFIDERIEKELEEKLKQLQNDL